MGRVSQLVAQAISERLQFGSQSGFRSSTGSRFIPPLLECDYKLVFTIEGKSASSVTSFVLTGLSGYPATVQWSPMPNVYGVPQVTVSESYFSLSYLLPSTRSGVLSSDLHYLYSRQFTEDGLLRLPMRAGGSYGLSFSDQRSLWSRLASGENLSSQEFAALQGPGASVSTGFQRPDAELYLLLREENGFHAGDVLRLCTFTGCVFGSPVPSFNPGSSDGMRWSMQVGYKYITWDRPSFLSSGGSESAASADEELTILE